jgi:hypothetical protein
VCSQLCFKIADPEEVARLIESNLDHAGKIALRKELGQVGPMMDDVAH